jgi:cob(I)alamin adenosyltransferase
MAVTTKTGDRGITSLLNGERVSKDDLRIEFNGEMDELNALLGLCKATLGECDRIETVQRELMIIMSLVARATGVDKPVAEKEESVLAQLEQITASTEQMERYVMEHTAHRSFDFVLPGRNLADAALHLARTKVRTCERRWVSLRRAQAVSIPEGTTWWKMSEVIGVYLNRLSDYLFCMLLSMD